MEKQIILPEHVELTEEVKTLYRDKDGKYYLTKEGAQNKLATHLKCDCGNGIREKYRVYCSSCEPPKPKPAVKDWDGESMLYVSEWDKYFNEVEEIEDYCVDEDIDKHDLTIYICEGNYLWAVSDDYWADIYADDVDELLPKEIQVKLDELNEAIKNYNKPISWSPSKYIAKFEWND